MGTDFTQVAGLLANPARAAMVDALFEGRPLAAGELARVARVSLPTASEHLAALVGGGLLTVTRQGRHRYFALAGPDVAAALESLSLICPPSEVRSLKASSQARNLGFARTCYDHLAGRLGVALHEAVVGRGWLVPAAAGDYTLTASGRIALERLGLDVAGAAAAHRSFARACLDWTERRPHLAGALAAAITAVLLDRRWLARSRTGRGITVTPVGDRELPRAFGVDVEALSGGPTSGQEGEDQLRSAAQRNLAYMIDHGAR